MIRQFQAEDAPACSQLIRESIRQDALIPDEAREDLLAMESARSMLDRGRLFYLAVSDLGERLAGLGGVEMNEIRLLLVSPEYRGRGIGRSILTHLESMVPSGFFSDLFVYASPAAEGFYRALDYVPQGEHSVKIAGCTLATIFMVKPI